MGRAPIYSILTKAAALTILLLIFDVVEDVVVGKFKDKTLAKSFPYVGGEKSTRISLYDDYLRHWGNVIILIQRYWSRVWRA
jgi:hypothetical protein